MILLFAFVKSCPYRHRLTKSQVVHRCADFALRDDKAFAVVGVEVEFDDTLNAISSENGRDANENITTTVLAVEESTNGEDTC